MRQRVRFQGWAWCFLIFLALAGITGCGVSPEGVAEEFVTRFAERAFENLDKYVAADQRAEFREFMAEYRDGLDNPRNPGQEMLAAMVLSVEDVESEVVSEDETSARVRISLEVEAVGPVKDAPFLDTDNKAILINEASAEGSLDIMLVKEKGRWMVDLMATSDLWDEALKFW